MVDDHPRRYHNAREKAMIWYGGNNGSGGLDLGVLRVLLDLRVDGGHLEGAGR